MFARGADHAHKVKECEIKSWGRRSKTSGRVPGEEDGRQEVEPSTRI